MWTAIVNYRYNQVIGILLFLSGIMLLSICIITRSVGYEIIEDYTECKNFHRPNIRCIDSLVYIEECFCFVLINIKEPMPKPVTIFYELKPYEQENINYYNSKDVKQLQGELLLVPSEDCEPFRYNDETKQPIAPCGAIADSMFNDTYSLIRNSSTSYVPSIFTGLITEDDKGSYKNPPGNLEQAFKNFSKPKSWGQNVWELDKNNPDNNGFQNERFIGWMKMDLERKPAWRINHTGEYKEGIPDGNYYLRIQYSSRHKGRRYVIISSPNNTDVNPVEYFSIGLIALGTIVIVGKIISNETNWQSKILKIPKLNDNLQRDRVRSASFDYGLFYAPKSNELLAHANSSFM